MVIFVKKRKKIIFHHGINSRSSSIPIKPYRFFFSCQYPALLILKLRLQHLLTVVSLSHSLWNNRVFADQLNHSSVWLYFVPLMEVCGVFFCVCVCVSFILCNDLWKCVFFFVCLFFAFFYTLQWSFLVLFVWFGRKRITKGTKYLFCLFVFCVCITRKNRDFYSNLQRSFRLFLDPILLVFIGLLLYFLFPNPVCLFVPKFDVNFIMKYLITIA